MQNLNTLTVKALRTVAKDAGLKGYSKLRKADLIAAIETHRRTAMNKTKTTVKGWIARICANGSREMIAQYSAIHTGKIAQPDVQFALADFVDGELFEWSRQINDHKPENGFWQIQDGQPVIVDLAIAEKV